MTIPSGAAWDRASSLLQRSLGVLLVGTSLAGCDALDRALNVDTPGQVPANLLESPDRAQLLLNGAIADFECALGGYIVAGAIVGNELYDATQTAARWSYDRRELSSADPNIATATCGGSPPGVYGPLSTARWSADNILNRLEGWTDAQVPNRMRMIATAAAYSAYSQLLLGEAFCSAAIDLSAELSSQQIFERAEQRFTQAIEAAQAAGAADTAAVSILNMARVGRARARINQGKKAEAAADARLVPTDFVRFATAAETPHRRINRVAQQFQFRWVSVSDAYRNLTVDGVPDPRVNAVNMNVNASDARTPFWSNNKYPTQGTPIPIATWREAQLILAEAVGGQEAVDIINTLRARHNLPQFSSNDEAAIIAQVIDERQRELFLEGHHWFDRRRFNLPEFPAVGTPHPRGGAYQDLRCFALPDVERFNNPNIP